MQRCVAPVLRTCCGVLFFDSRDAAVAWWRDLPCWLPERALQHASGQECIQCRCCRCAARGELCGTFVMLVVLAGVCELDSVLAVGLDTFKVGRCVLPAQFVLGLSLAGDVLICTVSHRCVGQEGVCTLGCLDA
jgi:hypothetical protein